MTDELEIFRDIFEFAGVGIYQTSPDGRFLRANQALADLNGYSTPEELVDAVQDIASQIYLDPMTRPRFMELMDKQGYVRNFVVRFRRHDGEERWASESAVPVRDEEGRLRYYVGTSLDITELVRLQDALEDVEGSYRDIFENANVGIYRSSPDGRQLRANPALVRLNGYESEAEQLAGVADIANEWYVDPGRREDFKRILARDGRISNFESEIYTHKTRRRIWIAENAWVVRDARGEPLYYEGTVQDITERKATEQALVEARQAAEDSSRAKSEFLANMSHELRTPLNAVIGFSETMLREMFGPIGSDRYLGYLRDIHDSAHLLLRLIEDILDVARVEAGKLALREETVDLADVAADSLRLLALRAERDGIRLANEIEVGQLRLRYDSARLRQIVLNLLSNAVKFTDSGGLVRLSVEALDDGTAELVVEDTGIGMAPDEIPRAFEPFVQFGPPARMREGTGLGLPLTRQLVEAHGGSVGLESRLGHGTRAAVRFPRDRIVL